MAVRTPNLAKSSPSSFPKEFAVSCELLQYLMAFWAGYRKNPNDRRICSLYHGWLLSRVCDSDKYRGLDFAKHALGS